MKASASIKNQLHALIWKEGSLFVAKGVEVEVASQGKTRNEAIKNLEEAIELYFDGEKISVPKGFSNVEVLGLS